MADDDLFDLEAMLQADEAQAATAAKARIGQGGAGASMGQVPGTGPRYSVTDPEQLSPAMRNYFENIVSRTMAALDTDVRNLKERVADFDGRIVALKNVALKPEERAQLDALHSSMQTMNANINAISEHVNYKVHNAINQLGVGLAEVDTKVNSPSASKKRKVETPEERLTRTAAQHVLHKFAEYLVQNDGKGWPDWPEGGADKWPRFADSVDGTQGRPCLRFDKEQDFDHPRNQQMAKYLLDCLDRERGTWAGVCKAQQAQLAKNVPREVFAQYLRTWFGTLSRSWRVERGRAAAAGTEVGASGDGVGPRQKPSTYDPRDPFRIYYGRRRTTSEYVAERRKVMPEYAGDEFAILDTKNAMFNIIFEGDFQEPGKRRWVRPLWMSARCQTMLEKILSHRLSPDSPEANNVNYLADVPISDNPTEVDAKPTWVKETFFSRLQRWMLNDEWLEKYGSANSTNIVPVDEPTSFEDVKRLDWYKKAAGINLGSVPTATVVARLSEQELVLANDDSNIESFSGFDTEQRAVGRHRRSTTTASFSSRAGSVVPY